MEFILTFGQRYRREPHPTCPVAHPDGYLVVRAHDEATARADIRAVLGAGWSGLYDLDMGDHKDWAAIYPLEELGSINLGQASWEKDPPEIIKEWLRRAHLMTTEDQELLSHRLTLLTPGIRQQCAGLVEPLSM